MLTMSPYHVPLFVPGPGGGGGAGAQQDVSETDKRADICSTVGYAYDRASTGKGQLTQLGHGQKSSSGGERKWRRSQGKAQEGRLRISGRLMCSVND